MSSLTTLALLIAAANGGAAPHHPPAHGAHGAHAHGGAAPAAPLVATGAFAPDGTLWLARAEGGHVEVSSSSDLGKTFSAPVRVNAEIEKIDANGEARPKVAVGPEGEVFVSYTRRLEKGYTGEILVSRSTDGGKTFSKPLLLTEGLSSGRFDTLAVAPGGEVHVFFIGRGETKEAGLYQAVSTDRGKTFPAARRVKANVCECCRLAIAWDGATPVVFWRDMLEGSVRDHCVARLDGARETAVVRATDDGWTIMACPHHGPAIAVGAGGVQHLAWFTGDGQRGKGVFYRRSSDGGRTFAAPVRLGDTNAGHPDVLAAGRSVWLAWKEPREGDATAVVAMRSGDAGATWSEPKEVARTTGTSDHPLLVAHREHAYLSWLSQADGYRLLPLDR
jgi:hypothetical protein